MNSGDNAVSNPTFQFVTHYSDKDKTSYFLEDYY